MYDAGKIIPGLLVFVGIVTIPMWYNAIAGGEAAPPEIEKPEGYENCVAETEFMRRAHMDLVADWRDASVRDGDRVWVAHDGQRYLKSLTGTCLGCHTDKSASCDRCHEHLAVQPVCWDCHVVPGGEN
jgi:hypothetical protein